MPSPYRRSRVIARRGVQTWHRSSLGRTLYKSRAAFVLPRGGFRPVNVYLPGRRRQVRVDLGRAEAVAFFIGYPRSGHTALAAVINGHPEALIAHELDLFRWLQLGADRGHLLSLIAERDRWFAKRGRQWETYDYNVPLATYGGQAVKVVGDKMAGVTSGRLRHDPSLLQRARDTFQMPLRAINVVRNPYDNIATMHRKHGRTLAECINRYGQLSESVSQISALLHNDELLTLRSERLISDPAAELARVWDFLGLTDSGDYVDRAPAFVMSTPSLTRQQVTWSPDDIDAVAALIQRYPHLAGYSFDVGAD